MRALIDVHLGESSAPAPRSRSGWRARRAPPRPSRSTSVCSGFSSLAERHPGGRAAPLTRARDRRAVRDPRAGRLPVHADLIEALIGTGELERADEPCSRSSRRAPARAACRGRSRPARAAAGCCSQLGASSTRPSSRSTAALAEHERLPMPFERARTLLALGLLQRRRNERRRAHESLEQAHRDLRGASVRRSGSRERSASCVRSAGARRAADADPGRAARRRARRRAG